MGNFHLSLCINFYMKLVIMHRTFSSVIIFFFEFFKKDLRLGLSTDKQFNAQVTIARLGTKETSWSFHNWQPAPRWRLLPGMANPGNPAMSPHADTDGSWNGPITLINQCKKARVEREECYQLHPKNK